MACSLATLLRQRGPRPTGAVALRLLGGFELVVNGKLVELANPAQRLIAIVALRRARVSRARAAELIWPDTDNRHAQGRLRTTMWRLRQACEGLLDAGGGLMWLDDSVEVDVHELLPWAARVASGEHLFDVRFLGLSDWELLPGWDDPWVVLEREPLRQLRLHALEDHARALMRRGIFGGALQAALAAIAAEPLRESGYRILIEIHLAEGNLGEASRTYRHYRRLLEDELGVEPSPNLRALLTRSGLLGHCHGHAPGGAVWGSECIGTKSPVDGSKTGVRSEPYILHLLREASSIGGTSTS